MGKPGTRGGGFRPGSAADRVTKKRAAKLNPASVKPPPLDNAFVAEGCEQFDLRK